MYHLVAERLLRETMEIPIKSEHVENGKLREAEAITKFIDKSGLSGLSLKPVGFVTTNDGRIGASPECLVGSKGGLEVKCPAPWTQIGYLMDGLGNDYRPQVQGQLYVGEFEVMHFFSYHPRMPAKYIETHRDEKYIKALDEALKAFCEELDKQTERVRKMGEWFILDEFKPTPELSRFRPEGSPWAT